MKKYSLIFIFLLIVLFLGAQGCSRKDHKETTSSPNSVSTKKPLYYTCSMHPWVRSDKPGTCPVCGMNLTPIYDHSESSPEETHQHPESAESKESLKQTSENEPKKEKKILHYVDPMHPWYKSDKPGKAPDCGMDLIPVYEEEASTTPSVMKETGRVTVRLSPEKQQLIGVKTELVERRNLTREIHATGRVAYHPELLVAQSEYLIALKTAHSQKSEFFDLQNSLVQSAKNRLRLLGMSEAQIQELSKKGKAQMNFLLPERGDAVWIYGSLYESDLAWVKAGTTVQVSIPGSSDPYTTSIESIDPTIDPMTRTAQARFRISNSQGLLKPDMYVRLVLKAEAGEALAIPNNAILSTGTRKIAFVDKGEGKFEPRILKVGKQGSDYVEVLSGVSQGERVVTSANFLIDSESQLKAVLSNMGGHP